MGSAEESEWRMRNHSRALESPLSVVSGMGVYDGDWSRGRSQTEKRLPKWWPVTLPPPLELVDKQEYQREANRLIRGQLLLYITCSLQKKLCLCSCCALVDIEGFKCPLLILF